jgi:hypothetical protein
VASGATGADRGTGGTLGASLAGPAGEGRATYPTINLLVRGGSAAATHAVLDWLTGQGAKRGRRVEYSIGWVIGEPERAAITAVSATAWTRP